MQLLVSAPDVSLTCKPGREEAARSTVRPGEGGQAWTTTRRWRDRWRRSSVTSPRRPGWPTGCPRWPRCRPRPGQPAGIGVTFGLRLRRGGRDIGGTGELIAYEPPWSVAYRVVAGSHIFVLRVTCVSSDGATQVHIRQADGAAPLAVDLGRLPEHISGGTAGPGSGRGRGDGDPAAFAGSHPRDGPDSELQ